MTAVFSPGLARQLTRFAQAHEASLFMLLLAGFQALLGRLTGQWDIPIGSPVANRNQPEVEPLIGFFVNLLVLRGDLAGDPSFRDLLARVRQATLDAYAHQDLPFELLVEELRPQRHLSASPLFQVMFALQNAPMGSMDLPGLSFAPLEVEPSFTRFDLELNAWESEGSLVLSFIYSAELFDRATVQRLAGSLEALLRSAAAGRRPAALRAAAADRRGAPSARRGVERHPAGGGAGERARAVRGPGRGGSGRGGPGGRGGAADLRRAGPPGQPAGPPAAAAGCRKPARRWASSRSARRRW